MDLRVLEICAGAGGQSSGLELAGFSHEVAVELDRDAADTLRVNRPHWHVFEGDVRDFNGRGCKGIDLLAGGVPCPPFSLAGKQLGADDERDLFPEALRLVREARPKAVLLENVKGLATKRFQSYRQSVLDELTRLGYNSDWKLLLSSEYEVPQLRPRFILVAFRGTGLKKFSWPAPTGVTRTVGGTLLPLMSSNGWPGAEQWAAGACAVAPTIVGGSKKHGGADLGPTRAKAAWAELGVDGMGIADEAPGVDAPLDLKPRLTNQMVALLQGFDPKWSFSGRKTSVYRQVGNAFPPPVAYRVGLAVRQALGVVDGRL